MTNSRIESVDLLMHKDTLFCVVDRVTSGIGVITCNHTSNWYRVKTLERAQLLQQEVWKRNITKK